MDALTNSLAIEGASMAATYLTLLNTLAARLELNAAHHSYINALSASGMLI